jgi:hypothetical protein
VTTLPPTSGLGLVAISRGIFTLLPMGLVQALNYQLPVPSALQRAMWPISSSRPGAWLFARSLPQIDKFVLRISRGQVTLTGITGGSRF